MTSAVLEHINLTVRDPKETAGMLGRVFGWHIRWEGPAMDNGYTVHVGTDTRYLALYRPHLTQTAPKSDHTMLGKLNHIAILVDNIEAAEKRVTDEGLVAHNHGDYEPGRRFYFHDADGLEFEVVSYSG